MVAIGCTFSAPAGTGGPAPTGDAAAIDGALGPDAASIDAQQAACRADSDYEPVDSGAALYRFLEGPLEAADAETACAEDEARLAVVTSAAQMTAIAAELESRSMVTADCTPGGTPLPCALIGLRQAGDAEDTAEGWRRSDGTAFAGNDPMWRPQQPDDDGGGENGFENCAVIYTSVPAGIDDRPCTGFDYPAVCECP